MKCVLCKGEMKEGKVNLPVDLEERFILVKSVPALICEQCGEYFISDEVMRKLELIVEEAKSRGVEIEILRFAA
ncbi:TPA: type II toxin-antitoxin system MqsA family antitoxin [Candidatus Poribacteria bacterium]|nr:type II toxin-antitoxin system MqsA family antitoxin [Candidatus Poribacteria bacterium]HEX30572.1 type II toxin-antitoxin system MqsA family antitoxin [Candidatus Poribacteria bacterium]